MWAAANWELTALKPVAAPAQRWQTTAFNESIWHLLLLLLLSTLTAWPACVAFCKTLAALFRGAGIKCVPFTQTKECVCVPVIETDRFY